MGDLTAATIDSNGNLLLTTADDSDITNIWIDNRGTLMYET